MVGDGAGSVPSSTTSFWAGLLGLAAPADPAADDRPDIVRLTGPTPAYTVWLHAVREPHTVKNRVNLDLHSAVDVPVGTRRPGAGRRRRRFELSEVPGLPFDGFVFVAVPERKTVKNRLHWDVTLQPGSGVDDLVPLGAAVVRRPDDEVSWTVMAHPEGNEFCVFEPAEV